MNFTGFQLYSTLVKLVDEELKSQVLDDIEMESSQDKYKCRECNLCEDDYRHVKYITSKLNESQNSDQFPPSQIQLLVYFETTGFEFVKRHKRMENTVIQKCLEFKKLHSDIPFIVEICDRLLSKLLCE